MTISFLFSSLSPSLLLPFFQSVEAHGHTENILTLTIQTNPLCCEFSRGCICTSLCSSLLTFTKIFPETLYLLSTPPPLTYLIILCFSDTTIFTNRRLVTTLWWVVTTQVYWIGYFPTAMAHFVSPCQIFVTSTMFPTFSLLLYLLWWSVVSDLDVTILIVFGFHRKQWITE